MPKSPLDYQVRMAMAEARADARGFGAGVDNGVRLSMQICISMLNISNMAVFLPGWELSEGAQMEHAYCKKCGTPVTYINSAEDFEYVRKSLEMLTDLMEVLS